MDHDAAVGPLSVFEPGVILLYLADRCGRIAPTGARARRIVGVSGRVGLEDPPLAARYEHLRRGGQNRGAR